MFERIGNFLPGINQVFVSLAHNKVEILIFVSWYDTIVYDPLLVLYHRTPTIAMQCVQERKTSSVQPRVEVRGSTRKRYDLYLQGGSLRQDVAEREVRDFGVIVWQGSIGTDYRSQHENRRVRAIILSMVFDGTK